MSKKDRIGSLLGQRAQSESQGADAKEQLIRGMQEASATSVRKPSRRRFEDTHTRATVYLENELLELLNQAAGDEKGEKTRIVNAALRAYLGSGS